MKDMWVRNKKSKFSLKSKILLAALSLVIIAALGTAAQAAVNRNSYLLGTDAANSALAFDPFNPNAFSGSFFFSGLGATDSSTGSFTVLASRPPIRIPYRPALRSPFRPPLP